EQAMLGTLAVFRGGFEREAAEQVAGASLHTLTALVDKSLLHVTATGRYDMHELLRQYNEEYLQKSGDTAAARTAHSTYYLGFLHQREADLKGRRQLAALDEVEADFENVSAAWRWAASQKAYETIDQALESLYLFCE